MVNLYTQPEDETCQYFFEILPKLHYTFNEILLNENCNNEILTEIVNIGTSIMYTYGWYPIIDNTEEEIKYINTIKKIRQGYELTDREIYILDYSSYKYVDLKQGHNPNSFDTFLKYGDTGLYRSNRSKTDMSIFNINKKTSNINLNELRKIRQGKIIKLFNHFVIPVARYAESIDTGLHHPKKSKKQYCGTFYYFELDSNTLLFFDNYIIEINKFSTAWKFLCTLEGHDVTGSDIIQLSKRNDTEYNTRLAFTLYDFITSLNIFSVYKDFRNTTVDLLLDDYIRFIHGDEVFNFDINYVSYKTGDIIDYINNFYATEDTFDQIICEVAWSFNYDVIILTNMVTETRTVSEILDVRHRNVSFDSLINVTTKPIIVD